jgi:hypothetical protein
MFIDLADVAPMELGEYLHSKAINIKLLRSREDRHFSKNRWLQAK